MASLLFPPIDVWESIKTIATTSFLIMKWFWFIYLPLFVLLIIKVLFQTWLNRRRGARIDVNLRKENGANELEKFANLKDRGVISEEEFQQKKREILGK